MCNFIDTLRQLFFDRALLVGRSPVSMNLIFVLRFGYRFSVIVSTLVCPTPLYTQPTMWDFTWERDW